MSILVDRNTRLIVQGLTGREGTFHAKGCASYGTQVVGGVTPGKGGSTHEGWPIFNTVSDAERESGANDTVIVVPLIMRDVSVLYILSERVPYVVDGLHYNRGLPDFARRAAEAGGGGARGSRTSLPRGRDGPGRGRRRCSARWPDRTRRRRSASARRGRPWRRYRTSCRG